MPYMGSKTGAGVYQAIIAQFPPHDTYIETHLGTGAVMRLKPPAARSIGIEIDPRTLTDYPPPAGAEIVNGDCLAFLRTFDFAAAGRVLIYADPPYPPGTRSSAARYRFDYSEDDHRALLEALCAAPAAVILSSYPNALYDALLPGWRTHEFQAMTRGGPRTERIYMKAGAVHWASFAGRNFTHRQQIKRKAARWKAKYEAMPPAERLAVLAALMEAER